MNIPIEKIPTFVKKGQEFTVDPDSEKHLLKLLEIQKQVDEAVKQVKIALEMKMKQKNYKLDSIKGEKVTVFFQTFGSKYKLDETKINDIPKELYKTTYAPDSKAIETWAKENKGLCEGIIQPKRPSSLRFRVKK